MPQPLTVITGASSGIGLAVARAFAAAGHPLLLIARKGVRVVNIAPGYVKTNIHRGMGISFEDYCRALGNPDFMTAEELAEVILYCYRLPPHLCVRDLVIAPTRTTF